ncbi:MAG: transglutaminase domain-containing protein [Oscillospiraceae bacterium]|nr:transglutaminase domain-containing protein [Oscillospiraceae bacterium]
MLFGGHIGIPDSIAGYIVSVVFSLWIIILKNAGKKSRLINIGVVTVFIIGITLVLRAEQRQFLITEYGFVFYVILLSTAGFIIGILSQKTLWIKRIISLSLFAYSVSAMILKWDITKILFSLICFVILIHIAEEIQHRWKKEGTFSLKEHIARISPVLIVLCVAIYFIPVSDKPYDWQFVKDIYNKAVIVVNRFSGFITHPKEEYGNIGFSENGGFSGTLKDNDDEVLFISSDNSGAKNLRLTGVVSKEFDGRKWEFDTKKKSDDKMFDTLETTSQIRKYDAKHQYDYMRKVTLSYENRLYNTKYIFAPQKMLVEPYIKGNPSFKDKNSSIISDKRLSYGDRYYISYYILNSANPELISVFTEAEEISEEEWNENLRKENVSGYSYEDYRVYRESIYQNYLDTDGVSDKVSEILSEIKGNSSDRYEMMTNLSKYLSGFEYSTETENLPDYVTDGKSYLDYFLLESKKGYCMHYATAFVLMAREMGVPCRYVQGYSAVVKNPDGTVILNGNAHAWPEVYFDNVGWIAFEATPGYSVGNGWKVIGSGGGITMPPPSKEDLPQKNETTPDKIITEEKKFDIRFVIIPVACVVGFLAVFFVLNRIFSKIKYKRMKNKEKFLYLTEENLKLLKFLGFSVNKGETLSEYKERLLRSEKYDFSINSECISIYEEYLYADREITEDDTKLIEKSHSDLRGFVGKTSLRYRLLIMFMR